MGGGGFSMEQGNPLLDDFVLSLSRRHPARVCFIPTASADSPRYLVKFYRTALAEAVSSRPDAGAAGGRSRGRDSVTCSLLGRPSLSGERFNQAAVDS
jgi:hypothetical protein